MGPMALRKEKKGCSNRGRRGARRKRRKGIAEGEKKEKKMPLKNGTPFPKEGKGILLT